MGWDNLVERLIIQDNVRVALRLAILEKMLPNKKVSTREMKKLLVTSKIAADELLNDYDAAAAQQSQVPKCVPGAPQVGYFNTQISGAGISPIGVGGSVVVSQPGGLPATLPKPSITT